MGNNYINRLHVKGFRLFDELNVEFNKGFNFIIGKNGCGKTSLLRAIILAYSNTNMEDSRYDDNFESWIDFTHNGNIDRIGISSHSGKNLYRNAPDPTKINSLPTDGVDKTYFHWKALDLNFCPLVLGAFRKIDYTIIDGMAREENVLDARHNYITNSPSMLNGGFLPNVKQWMINRYFQIDKDWAIKEKQNWDWLICNLKNLGPSNIDFQFLNIERDLEVKFKVNDRTCYLEELSSGFQSVLSIVLSIFEWIEKTNDKNAISVKHATGTVIIDEIDVHLHPEWQLTLKKSLECIFPNIQFIVTTHSPHIIATASPGEIIILDHNDNLNNTLSPINKSYNGWNTDQILDEIMGVSSLSNKLYDSLISKAMKVIEEKNIVQLKEIISELEKISHPSDSIVSVLKIKLSQLNLED